MLWSCWSERSAIDIVKVNVSVSGLRCFIKYRAGKRRCRGSTGAFTRLCAASVVTSFQNSANVSSAVMVFNVLMVMAVIAWPSAAESDFLCRHTHSSCYQYAGADCDPTPSQKNSNCCICTCTPRIRAFISMTVEVSNYQFRNSWSTL